MPDTPLPSLPHAILDHMAKNTEPASSHAIGKAIGRSAGAVTVALGYLAKAGNVKQVNEKPRQYVIEPKAPAYVARTDRPKTSSSDAKKARVDALNEKLRADRVAKEVAKKVPAAKKRTGTVTPIPKGSTAKGGARRAGIKRTA